MAVMILATGCNSESVTLNEQRSALRGAADLAGTVAFARTESTAETVQAVGKIAAEIETFLETGNAISLTTGEICAQLTVRIPANYQLYFATAVAILSSQNVNTSELIPANVMKRLRAAILGVKTACAEWEPEG